MQCYEQMHKLRIKIQKLVNIYLFINEQKSPVNTAKIINLEFKMFLF